VLHDTSDNGGVPFVYRCTCDYGDNVSKAYPVYRPARLPNVEKTDEPSTGELINKAFDEGDQDKLKEYEKTNLVLFLLTWYRRRNKKA